MRSAITRFVITMLLCLGLVSGAFADSVYLPLVTAPATIEVLPDRLELEAPDYGLVGAATAFAACTGDGVLLVSAYAVRPDGTQGHTVFIVNVPEQRLHEVRTARGIPTRGSLVGYSAGLEGCGGGPFVWSVGLNEQRIVLQRVRP
jgi:hypothetical protein